MDCCDRGIAHEPVPAAVTFHTLSMRLSVCGRLRENNMGVMLPSKRLKYRLGKLKRYQRIWTHCWLTTSSCGQKSIRLIVSFGQPKFAQFKIAQANHCGLGIFFSQSCRGFGVTERRAARGCFLRGAKQCCATRWAPSPFPLSLVPASPAKSRRSSRTNGGLGLRNSSCGCNPVRKSELVHKEGPYMQLLLTDPFTDTLIGQTSGQHL